MTYEKDLHWKESCKKIKLLILILPIKAHFLDYVFYTYLNLRFL